jgi:hypothetical protein
LDHYDIHVSVLFIPLSSDRLRDNECRDYLAQLVEFIGGAHIEIKNDIRLLPAFSDASASALLLRRITDVASFELWRTRL